MSYEERDAEEIAGYVKARGEQLQVVIESFRAYCTQERTADNEELCEAARSFLGLLSEDLGRYVSIVGGIAERLDHLLESVCAEKKSPLAETSGQQRRNVALDS